MDQTAAKEVWNTITPLLAQRMNDTTMRTFFSDIEPLEFTGSCLVLCSPVPFKRTTISSLYLPTLKEAAKELFSVDIEIEILSLEQKQERYATQTEEPTKPVDLYTFDRFIVGASNRFAYSAAYAVAHAPGSSSHYNPLFIYGNPGLGKTHLVYAIYNEIKKDHPDFRVVFTTGDKFTTEVTDAIKQSRTEQLRSKYRFADLLIVDDIQTISGRDATQVEFFNTFNDLYEAGNQIIMTSDRLPSDIPLLEERLRSRFEWGLMADIKEPEYETRLAILREKAEQMHLKLPQAAMEYIAKNITESVRQMEGVLSRLLAYYQINEGDVTNDDLIRSVEDLIHSANSVLPTPQVIIEETAKAFNVTSNDILSSIRTRDVTLARQVAMYIIRVGSKYSTTDVGKVFSRDHTTVIHSISKIEAMVEEDSEISERIRAIRANIAAKKYD